MFDPATWIAGYRGKSVTDPIYIYKGQIVDAVTEGKTVYYKYTSSKKEAVNISVIEGLETATIKVYNKNMNLVKTINGTENNSQNVSWNAKINTDYIIEISNGQNIKFKIK